MPAANPQDTAARSARLAEAREGMARLAERAQQVRTSRKKPDRVESDEEIAEKRQIAEALRGSQARAIAGATADEGNDHGE